MKGCSGKDLRKRKVLAWSERVSGWSPNNSKYDCWNKQADGISCHGRPYIGSNAVSWPPGKRMKNSKAKTCKKSSFLCLCCILRAIRADRCRERRYADHIFIQIYFRMHHFVVKLSKFSSPQAARGHWSPLSNLNPADVPAACRWLLFFAWVQLNLYWQSYYVVIVFSVILLYFMFLRFILYCGQL